MLRTLSSLAVVVGLLAGTSAAYAMAGGGFNYRAQAVEIAAALAAKAEATTKAVAARKGDEDSRTR